MKSPAGKQHQLPADKVESGMEVEATGGDLGTHDVSKPRVEKVVRDAAGKVRDVIVEKGTIFRKQIAVPADRVEKVNVGPGDQPGEVVIETTPREVHSLRARGKEDLTPQRDPLGEVQQTLPTAEGLRRLKNQHGEATEHKAHRGGPTAAEATAESKDESKDGGKDEGEAHSTPAELARTIGPGFLSGSAGNDSSAVTSYSIDGATAGYGQLWLMLLATPLYQAVQYTCAKLGRVTGSGLAGLLREHYGRKVAVPATLLLIVANLGLVTADLVAIGTGLQLLTGIVWEWFVVPVAVVLWYVTVYKSFNTIKKVFIALSLAFVAYLVTGIISGADWGTVLHDTVVPQISLNFAGVSAAVALLGATVSPYTMFWQVEGEREQRRPGPRKLKLRLAAADIAAGTISGNLVAYFIIVSTAATLYAHHQHISSAADAASALAPLVGPYAKDLFAIGLIGAGLVAIPVLLASTSFGVAGTFGWPEGLSKKPWQAEGFYLILTAALVVSLLLALLRFDPITLLFWVNVLQGVLAPALVILLAFAANNRRVMGKAHLAWYTNFGLIATAVVMSAAALLLIVGLLTGQG